ncbi:PAX-interacting protein 1 [Toxocara canis]|uniref:PAX-interacting protein 1 n=1 Tax=Toxocara canis TaxID=6265 RepID=A0A0B2VIF1_TOXCA|nr:PAX-interacting protein 1 [Toxocara canis]
MRMEGEMETARYPTPVQNASGISPCYPPTAHDMRSPQLMSPTQAPVVPAGVPQAAPPTMVAPVPASAPPMQRSMSNMDMQGNGTTITPQHMRMVPQSAPFYGHEPNIANNVSPDMCLMGCFFVVVEHERVLVDRLDVQEISAVVRLHGGEIEFGPRAYNGANADRITHVICESLRHQLVQQALKERKRCVTLQWLNDVLAKKHLEAPFRVSHLPTFWAENHRPATGKSKFCSVEGEKVERSRELGVTVVNYQWLVELYLGIKTAVHDNESGYYPMPGMFPEVNVSPYTLELYSEVCKQLLAAWRAPVMFSTEQWQRASEVKRNVENDESIFPNKKLRMSTPPPSEEQIEERRSQLGSLKDAPIVCFSGFTADEVAALEKIIAINGFNQNERSGIRMMITAIGARFTPYLTKHNHFLVTKTVEGEKVERSRELGVTVVNYQWLVELYLGIKTAVHDNESGYYPMPGMFPEVNVSPYTLELYSEVCKQLLAAWRAPVMFSTEQWQRASEVKRNVENDESIFPNKKLRMSTPPPSEEQIEERRSQLGSLKDAPIVCFSGFTADEVAALEKKVRFLGGRVTDNVSECTHLVVLNLWRTMKLLEAIALGKNVVGANWITDGYRCRVIPDTLDYFARDEENEKAFGYNLKYSVLRARYRRVFEEVTFYVTPSVEPSYKAICSLITTAGGKLLKDRPQPHLVIQCIETDAPLILVGNESDVHLLQYLTDCGMPVFNVEIVLTGILRQKLENSSLYRVAPVRPPVHQSPAPPATPATRTQNAAQRVAT